MQKNNMIRIILLIFLAFPLAMAGECESLYLSLSGDESTLSVCKKEAEAGDSVAQYHLGLIYLSRQGSVADKKEGVKWIKLSAEQGYAEAQFFLAGLYSRGLRGPSGSDWNINILGLEISSFPEEIVKRDMVIARKWARLAAEQGHAGGQVVYGALYVDDDLGVKANPKEALKWFRLAAEQGDKDGQAYLGEAYYFGHGVEKDYTEALKWLLLAAEQGVVKYHRMIGHIYFSGESGNKDLPEALKWALLAAEQGDVISQLAASHISYKLGDKAEAFRLIKQSLESGLEEEIGDDVSSAYSMLGWMYYHGEGTTVEKKRALELFRLADYKPAIGWMYYNGEAVELDRKKGRQLIYSSAEVGDPEAQSMLGWMYYNGEGVEQDKEEALKWYRLSAANSYPHPSSSYELGVIYREGDIVEQDLRQSYIHFLVARKRYSDFTFPFISTVRQPPEDVESEIKSLETLLTEEQITSAKQEVELMLQQ